MVGANGQLIAFLAMDEVISVSINLAINKAYTAVMGQKDTLLLEEESVSPSNFCDPRFCCFGGGIPPYTADDRCVGAIGVSGRESTKGTIEERKQDHELAYMGIEYFKWNTSKRRSTVST